MEFTFTFLRYHSLDPYSASAQDIQDPIKDGDAIVRRYFQCEILFHGFNIHTAGASSNTSATPAPAGTIGNTLCSLPTTISSNDGVLLSTSIFSAPGTSSRSVTL